MGDFYANTRQLHEKFRVRETRGTALTFLKIHWQGIYSDYLNSMNSCIFPYKNSIDVFSFSCKMQFQGHFVSFNFERNLVDGIKSNNSHSFFNN